jgi:RNA polymerase sigma-32 factor
VGKSPKTKIKPVKKTKATAGAKPRTLKSGSAKSAKSLKDFKPVEAEVVDPDSVLQPPEPADDDTPEIVDDFPVEPLQLTGSDAETGLASSDPVARYLSEIGRYPLLSREEEQRLAMRYRETGDAKAAEQLVTSNLRFVVKVAAEYSKFGARLIDLVQEGNVGLMHAVKEFNPYKGVRLITYAVWWIRGYIQEYLMRQYSMVRIGTTANQRKLFYQLQREREKLEKMGFEQGVAQISGKLGVSREEVQEMHGRLSGRDISLDAPVTEDGSARRIDLQTVEDPVHIDEELDHRQQLHVLMDKIEGLKPELNERELFLLEARLLSDEPMTLQEIGDKYGTTREAVRQMEVRLMTKIRKSIVEDEAESPKE